MKPFGTIDLETDPFSRPDNTKPGRIPKAFAGALYVNGRTAVAWSKDCCEFIVRECCKNKYKDFIFYAHNGGKFDFHFLLHELLKLFDYDLLEVMCIGSRIVKIKTPACEFRDSFCIIPKALKAIAHAEKGDIDFGLMEEDKREEHKAEILSYLKQDVKGLYSALEKFFETYGQEITLASTCFKILKKQFLMPSVKTNEKYDSDFRRYYFAGRVQFFQLGKLGNEDGKKRYTIVDINSAFPWAMRFRHWFSGEYITIPRPPKNNKEQCFYEIVCDSDGVLPSRQKCGGVAFPLAEQTHFYATGWEFFAGIELGKIRNVKILKIYMPTELRSFADYVDHFYALKQCADETGNQGDRDLYKLALNGPYGKFALNSREFREVKITNYGDIPEPHKVRLKNNTEIKIPFEKSYDDFERGLSFWQRPSHFEGGKPLMFNNVCTAASITGCVRAYLARSMAKCRNVVYCDTDSIIAEDTSKIEIGNDLGKWKIEKECDSIHLAGKKLYAAHDYRGAPPIKGDGKPAWKEWKTASKGVRLSPEQICQVATGEEVSYSFDAPNYSVFSGISFTTRRVNRDDKRRKSK